MLTFNNNIPLVLFKVQQVGTMVQIKPYASYYQWIDWFDLAPLDFTEAIDVLTGIIFEVNEIALAAAEDAAQGLADASNAQAAADDAQSDVDDLTSVVIGINGTLAARTHTRATMWHAESKVIVGTPTYSRNSAFDFGHFFHAGGSINNECTNSFVADLSGGGYIRFNCLTNNGSGILTLTIDGISAGTVDFYSAVQNTFALKEIALGDSVWSNGHHVINIKSVSKHLSSSNYFLLISKFYFTQDND